jgi:hypothetical protein
MSTILVSLRALIVSWPMCALALGPAHSEGAFAVGSTGDVSKHGIAYGGAYNYRTRAEAEAGALKACRDFKGAPQAVKQCRIVATFTRECYAQANDPKAGTPGTGWAIAQDEETARARAMAACQVSAGANRAEYCVIELSRCDVND